MVLLLLEFLFHISRQQNEVSLYTVLVLLRIWRLLIIPLLRRNFASVVCEGRCKVFVVEHSLRPRASVQCEGAKAVSCGRKAATRASFPPCWGYMAHQCRRSRHRRAHSCSSSWTNAWQDIHRQAAERLALMGRAVSVMQSMKRLRRCGTHPPGQIRPWWLRHLVRAGLLMCILKSAEDYSPALFCHITTNMSK